MDEVAVATATEVAWAEVVASGSTRVVVAVVLVEATSSSAQE